MGSNNSAPMPKASNTKKMIRTMGEETAAQRRIGQLEAEKLEWQRQQQLEQHWRENKLREEQRRKDAEQAWLRQQQLIEQQRLQKCRSQEQNSQILQPQQQKLQTQQDQRPKLKTHKSNFQLQEASTSQKVLSEIEPKQNTPETYLTKMRASGISLVEWSIIEYIREQNSISESVAASVLKLLDNGNTVPFIGMYRKGATQGMNVAQVRRIKNSYDDAKFIKNQAVSIVKDVNAKGNWTPEFHAFVHESKSIRDLEYIHSIYKVTGVTPVSKAKDLGLGKIAEAVMKGNSIDPLCYLVKPITEGLKNEEQVKNGIVCIIVDMIIKDKRSLATVKNLKSRYNIIIETKVKGANPAVHIENVKKYESYINFKSTVNNLEISQICTIVQGEAEKALNVRIIIPKLLDKAFHNDCMLLYKYATKVSPLHESVISQAIDSVYNKSIKAYIRKLTIQEIYERAETASMEIIAQNVQEYMFTEFHGLLPNQTISKAVTAVLYSGDPIDVLIKTQRPSIVNKRSIVKLEGAIMDTICSVSIDLNLAMPTSVLKRLPGLDEEKAKNIAERRKTDVPFMKRDDLKRIKGINDKTFEQCAGFVKIMPDTTHYLDGYEVEPYKRNYFDQTTIHPESYEVAEAFLKAANCYAHNLGTKTFTFAVKLYADLGTATLAKKFGTTEDVIDSIVTGLMMEKPTIVAVNNDKIATMPNSKVHYDDLQIGTFLTGVVRNVNRFGVFVDVGAERDGLIIEKFMGGMTVSRGQKVETKVNTIEKDRRRFGLTLIKCL